jgi:hypothetical protein
VSPAGGEEVVRAGRSVIGLGEQVIEVAAPGGT